MRKEKTTIRIQRDGILETRPWKPKVPKEFDKAKDELDWFFHYGEASLGIKSNFDSLIRALQSSNTHEDANAEDQLAAYIDAKQITLSPEKLLKNTSKYNKIDRKFRKISFHNQNVLQHFYLEKQFDRSLEQYFGAGLCLIPFTETFKQLDKEINELKHSIIHKKSLMSKIKDEVSVLYTNALMEYHEKDNP